MARTKPSMEVLWAESGATVDPGASTTATGWVLEIPDYQVFNWILNRADEFMANVNDLGIPAWDTDTTYDEGSWAIGSDGDLYRSNTGSNTGNNPTTESEWDSFEEYIRILLVAELPTSDEKAAMTAANAPDAYNPFATMDDIPAATVMTDNLFHAVDEKTAGTAPQTLTGATWNTRDLGTVRTNNISGASLGSNQITLPAGTYFFLAKAPASATGDHKARLRDVTNSVTLGVGGGMSDTIDSSSNSWVSKTFTLAGSAGVELQHYSTGGGAGGVMVNGSEVEIYSEIWIWKVA